MTTICGKQIGPIGFGLMGLTWREPPTPYEEAFKTMKAALEAGANFWNGGEIYGTPEANSLHLLHAYFTRYPLDAHKVVLSIKGSFNNFKPEGDRAGITRSIEECLRVLDGVKSIDIFECARKDPDVPIEETVGYIAEFVKAGKIGGIGLSEVGAETIRRAAKVHRIEGVEVEYSLFATDIQSNGVANACAELGIPVLAYSPVGRGLLTGRIKSADDMNAFQKYSPWFQDENFEKNLQMVQALEKVAQRKGCTIAQLAIGWTRAREGKNGFPIVILLPGATTVGRVVENMKDVRVTAEELAEIEGILAAMPVAGSRVPKSFEHLAWG